jgi:hypothetical protein
MRLSSSNKNVEYYIFDIIRQNLNRILKIEEGGNDKRWLNGESFLGSQGGDYANVRSGE